MLIRPDKMSDGDWVTLQAKYAENLNNLVKSSGWEMFDQYMKSEEERLLSEMPRVKTGDDALRVLSAYSTAKAMRSWAPKMLEVLLTNLRK